METFRTFELFENHFQVYFRHLNIFEAFSGSQKNWFFFIANQGENVEQDRLVFLIGPLFLFVALYIVNINVHYSINQERDLKLREAMRMMGLSSSFFFFSSFWHYQIRIEQKNCCRCCILVVLVHYWINCKYCNCCWDDACGFEQFGKFWKISKKIKNFDKILKKKF